MVIDLDANDDGTLAGINGQSIQQLLTRPAAALGAVLNDIRMGVNGHVDLGFVDDLGDR